MGKERAIFLPEWPQPDTGAPNPVMTANNSSLFVRYTTQEGKVAVVHFPLCSIFTFGSPNDEALAGHPLYNHGLKYYAVHSVENSAWIALLEQRHSVHHRHDRKRFLEDKKHYVFTFHDSTLECVVNEGEHWPAKIWQYDSEDEADIQIRKNMAA